MNFLETNQIRKQINKTAPTLNDIFHFIERNTNFVIVYEHMKTHTL